MWQVIARLQSVVERRLINATVWPHMTGPITKCNTAWMRNDRTWMQQKFCQQATQPGCSYKPVEEKSQRFNDKVLDSQQKCWTQRSRVSPLHASCSPESFLFHEIGSRCSDRSVCANSLSSSLSGGNRVSQNA